MIREIKSNELDIIEFLIDDFLSLHYEDEDKRSQLKESLSLGIESQKYSLLVGFIDNRPFGFGSIRKSTRDLSMIHCTEGMWEKFLSEIIDYLKKSQSVIRIRGKFVPEFLYGAILGEGFTRYDREYMTVPYDSIRSLNQIVLPKEYSIIPYDPDTKGKIASMLLESYFGTSTSTIFPDFYNTSEGCHNNLELWEQSSRISILVMEKNPIGVCSTNLNGTILYVGNLSLVPVHHGKGLGKAFLVLSLLEASKEADQVQIASLEVTPSDKAYNLYKSLGFMTEDYLSYFVWTKP